MNEELVTRAEFTKLQAQLIAMQQLAEENNKILHAMRFWGRVAFIAKLLIWVGVLALPFIIYQLLAPTITPALHSFMSVFGTNQATSTGALGYPSAAEVYQYIQSHK